MNLFWVVPLSGILALAFAIALAWDVLRRDAGDKKMQEIGALILEGAVAFMRRQYQTIAILAVITSVLIGLAIGYFESDFDLGLKTSFAFLLGAFCSALSGFIGMYISVKSNSRCAAAARKGLRDAITVALRGGAVSGFTIVALSLLGVTAIFYAYGGMTTPALTPFLIVGFGFGASFVALFAQLGGGIYTKAADMGADLVGKIEAGIPEDDPRNAAVIADLVGDNVGDCAGRGADLFESTAAENIGAMILGVAIFAVTQNIAWILFPLVVRAFGLIATIFGILVVRGKEEENPMNALNRGYYLAIIISIIGMYLATTSMLQNIWYFWAGVVGILTSIAFVYITQYYTEGRFRPVRAIAHASRTGPATNIVSGTAVGYECTLFTAIAIGLALLLSFWLGSQTHLPNGGVYGTAVATMGMLMTCAYILSMDTFGPITDNANGIIEMANVKGARVVTDKLDAVGNTTKALTKGYAMGSAGLAAFLLFQAYMDKVAEVTGEIFAVVNIAKVEVFVGGLLAVMLVFLFSSLAMRAVGKTAGKIIEEVRRQFREDPGIMKGTTKPDYAKAVDITTKAGLREMVAPGLLAVCLPVAVGILFNIAGYAAAEAVAAVLMVGTIAGIIMATFMNNSGGAWDNAKKLIESGMLKDEQGKPIGKGTPTHAAAVVGDTVGDPFKDTVGPSLHVLVKLLSTVTLVLSPLFI
ncbi:MAG: sodium-translocating pyrophosphatase [Methanophagales archaeon ANME-1-THS]|nr:MAG: sodium-translocating pyrophosphatase [Methanophagales archaeon ANME-1-THS]